MPPRLDIWGACRRLAIRTQPAPRFAAVARPSHGPKATTTTPAIVFTRSLSDNISLPPSTPDSNMPDSSSPVPPLSSSGGQFRQPAENDNDKELSVEGTSEQNLAALEQLQLAAYGLDPFDPEIVGHKYGLPELPVAKRNHTKYRYEPITSQLTRLMMRDGKLAKAQRDMAMILNYLRTSPPPKYNPLKPLMPGSPPASHLPLDPVQYLTLAIDSVAPLVRISYIKGAAGGGNSLELPYPITLRQRRRLAFKWIMDIVEKKPSKGSGRTMLAHRIAEEIVAVIEGRSGAWDKRLMLHRQGTVNRANVTTSLRARSRPRRI